MMRRTVLLVWALLLCLPVLETARAEDRACIILPLQTEESRVKLREQPSREGKVLGQYFSGVEVVVHSASEGWAKVTIGGRKGYMMAEFLTEREPLQTAGGPTGCVRFPESGGTVRLYQQPAGNSTALAVLKENDPVRVLGTVGDNWLHVAVSREGKPEVYGFVSSLAIGKTENQASATVYASRPDAMVNLREAPERGAKIIGQYFCGTEVYCLYDDHLADDGWERVRLGAVTGYIMDDFLHCGSSGCPECRPPLAELKTERPTQLYLDAYGMGHSSLSPYDPFCVVGIFGNRYQIRYETWLDPHTYGYAYGFLSMSAVKTRPQSSVSTQGTALRDTTAWYMTREGKLESMGQVARGTQVSLYGAVTRPAATLPFLCQYVYPEAQYLLADVERPEGSWTRVYLPIGDIAYDPALNYPEIMTRG